MATAANLKAAADETVEDVQIEYSAPNFAPNVRGILDDFLSGLVPLLDADDQGHRTVLNWVNYGETIFNELNPDTAGVVPDAAGQRDVNAVASVIHRICRAAQFAETDGRISGTVAQSILDHYNATLP